MVSNAALKLVSKSASRTYLWKTAQLLFCLLVFLGEGSKDLTVLSKCCVYQTLNISSIFKKCIIP